MLARTMAPFAAWPLPVLYSSTPTFACGRVGVRHSQGQALRDDPATKVTHKDRPAASDSDWFVLTLPPKGGALHGTLPRAFAPAQPGSGPPACVQVPAICMGAWPPSWCRCPQALTRFRETHHGQLHHSQEASSSHSQAPSPRTHVTRHYQNYQNLLASIVLHNGGR
jgi:hypothetical protein